MADKNSNKKYIKEQILQIIAEFPKAWHKNARHFYEWAQQIDSLLANLLIKDIADLFPEKGNCTVKARWEVIWLVNDHGTETAAQLGLSNFFSSYRINEDIRKYREIREISRLLVQPNSFTERVLGVILKIFKIMP